MRILIALAFLAIVVATVAVGFTIVQGGIHDATKWAWIHDLFGREAAEVTVGDSAADGSLRFQVVGANCKTKSVDDDCTVRVRVRNSTSSSATLEAELQYLRFDDITVAATSVDPSPNIKEGGSPAKTIRWENVPSNGLQSVELHESLLSNGVVVKLTKAQ
jgi:hypothetical protein